MQASYTLDKFNSGRTVVGDAITELAKDDSRIWLLTPDIGWGCNDFKAAHPERFIDTGIAEQCVVGVSAGLALEGAIPFIIGMMPFMSMRDLEQVRTDLCYPNLPVRIIANYSGLTGNGGSTHYANASYCQLQMKFWSAGHRNVFVTTVEGYPEFDETLEFMRDGDYEDVLVYPLMLVAGDHANNDMAGDEDDSLKSVLTAAGYNVSCIIRGMGECPHFRELFLEHITDAVRKSEIECQDGGCGAPVGKPEVLVDHL